MIRLTCLASPRGQKTVRLAAWAALAVMLLLSLPFLCEVLRCGIDWISGLFPNPAKSWESLLWLR